MRAHVIDGDVLPGQIANVLPAGNLFEHKQADLIAGIEEVARLRVVGGADDVAPEVLAQDDGILRCTRAGMAWPTMGRSDGVEPAQLDDASG